MKIRTASAASLAACVITSSCSAAQLANFYCKAYVESFQISFASTNVTRFGVTVPTGELTAILDWELVHLGDPHDIISAINAEPGFKKKMEDGGFVLTDIGNKDMPTFMAEKKKEYAALAVKLGIKKQ